MGVAAWPRLASGQLDTDGDAFRLMYHVPGIEGLHALARQPRRCRTGQTAHRTRRSKPAEPVPVLHRHRSKRARQEPLQRARRHAVFHGLSARCDLASISTGAPKKSGFSPP